MAEVKMRRATLALALARGHKRNHGMLDLKSGSRSANTRIGSIKITLILTTTITGEKREMV
jgi:hypothetical protein